MDILNRAYSSDDSDDSYHPAERSDDDRAEPQEGLGTRAKKPSHRLKASHSGTSDRSSAASSRGGGGGTTLGDLIDVMKMKVTC